MAATLQHVQTAKSIERWVWQMIAIALSDCPCPTSRWDSMREQNGRVAVYDESYISNAERRPEAVRLLKYLYSDVMNDLAGQLVRAKFHPSQRHELVPLLAVRMEQDDARVTGAAWCIFDWLRNKTQATRGEQSLSKLCHLLDAPKTTAWRYRNTVHAQLDALYCRAMQRIGRHFYLILPAHLRSEIDSWA